MLTPTTGSEMPTRRFSNTILTGAWPQTDPAGCHSLSRTQQQKAVELFGQSDNIRSAATQVPTDQAGAAVDAFGASSHRLAGTVTDHADRYFAMSRASREVGHILHTLRADLDHIDARAHTRIDQIAQSATEATAVMAQTRIIQIIAAARGEATAKSASAATAIADQGARLGITTPSPKTGNPRAVPVSGPDDRIVDPGSYGPHIQQVDNTTGPQPPGIPGPNNEDALASLILPPPGGTPTPPPDAVKIWVDNMLKNLAARPPDDPVAAEARRLAWQALHQPKRCDGFEWTSSSLGLLGSLTGTVATIAGAPAGPADWALLGAALSGDAASAASLFKCMTQAAETPLQAVHP